MYVYKTRVYLISKGLNLLFNKLIGAYTDVLPCFDLLIVVVVVVFVVYLFLYCYHFPPFLIYFFIHRNVI